VPAILAGDYNVVPTPFDIYASKSWANDALVQPESRAAFRRIVNQGWTDAIRALHPNEPMYTFCTTCESDGVTLGYAWTTCSAPLCRSG
jgi:exodeoxyribonuclease-3